MQGHTAIVKLLLDAKCRVNPKDGQANTPLHLACEEGHGDTAMALIENGGNADQLNAEGKSPLDVCRTPQLRIYIQRRIEEES